MHANALLVGHRLAGLLQSASCICSSLVSPYPRLKHQDTLNNQTLPFLLLDLLSQQPSSLPDVVHDGSRVPVPATRPRLQLTTGQPVGCWELDDGTEELLQENLILSLIDLVHNLNLTVLIWFAAFKLPTTKVDFPFIL